MTSLIKSLSVATLILAVSAPALADKRKSSHNDSAPMFSGGTSPGKYGRSGCGLGSMAFAGKDDTVSQVLASTTNGTFGSQTFGISTGTSNCETHGVANSARIEQQRFVEANYDTLAQEAAQGAGEHLSAFASLMGCEQHAFSSTLRQNHGNVFVRDAKAEKVLDSVEQLAKTCRSAV